MAADEMFDVCDAQDNVIGQAPRAKVHALGWLHRAVHIWVWNSTGELLVQRRSAEKDQYPGCWTSSASGHVDAGEDYAQAAVRELREELQLSGELKFEAKLPASTLTAQEHTVLYSIRTDAAPVPDPAEIAALQWFPLEGLRALFERSPEQLTPPFRELLACLFQRR